VPGIDFSNDPLLAGRIHSYVDTQISRLGGPNFHEIPINAPVAQFHHNQRDGMRRQAINRGPHHQRVSLRALKGADRSHTRADDLHHQDGVVRCQRANQRGLEVELIAKDDH
ncbi:MAG: catalase, partial [Acidobacteriota bacterium]|nr:catalase [Acidobacteriota bacterium]